MKHKLMSLAAWANTDPQRIRFIMLLATAALAVVIGTAPNNSALAGWAPGGSD